MPTTIKDDGSNTGMPREPRIINNPLTKLPEDRTKREGEPRIKPKAGSSTITHNMMDQWSKCIPKLKKFPPCPGAILRDGYFPKGVLLDEIGLDPIDP